MVWAKETLCTGLAVGAALTAYDTIRRTPTGSAVSVTNVPRLDPSLYSPSTALQSPFSANTGYISNFSKDSVSLYDPSPQTSNQLSLTISPSVAKPSQVTDVGMYTGGSEGQRGQGRDWYKGGSIWGNRLLGAVAATTATCAQLCSSFGGKSGIDTEQSAIRDGRDGESGPDACTTALSGINDPFGWKPTTKQNSRLPRLVRRAPTPSAAELTSVASSRATQSFEFGASRSRRHRPLRQETTGTDSAIGTFANFCKNNTGTVSVIGAAVAMGATYFGAQALSSYMTADRDWP